MHEDHNASPLNPLPAIVWILALPMIAMEVIVNLGSRDLVGGPNAVGWRLDAMERFAFAPDILRWMMETGRWPGEHVMRLVTYPFVHVNFTSALFAIVLLLALGKMVAEVFRPAALLAVFFGSSVMAALVYTAVPVTNVPLIGAFPAVYGLIGAFTYLLWMNLAAVGANKARAFTLIGFLLGIQLVFGLLFGGGWDWVADVAGFATGFGLSFVVSPGGLVRLRDKLRQR